MFFFIYAFLLLALLSILSFVWLIAPARPVPSMKKMIAGHKYAHRGLFDNAGPAPENSMKAFETAIEAGYGIELDIRLTKDGKIVVFHDDTLARVCGLKQNVDALTLAELKELRLLGTAESIPEFGEFLSLVKERVPLLVEFKTGLPGVSRIKAKELCEAAMALLDAYSGPFVIESFDYMILSWFRAHRPTVMRGQLGMGLQCYVPALGKQGAEAIPLYRRRMLSWLLYNHEGRPHFISYRFQDAGFGVSLCRALGAPVSVWTVKTAEDSARLLARYDAVIFEGFLA
jgi:glycerophosphoryl diester phosphodiesterase